MSKYNSANRKPGPMSKPPRRNADPIWEMTAFRSALEAIFSIPPAALGTQTLADSHGAVVKNENKNYRVKIKGKPAFTATSDELATFRNCLNTMNLPTSFGADVRITEAGKVDPTIIRIGDNERTATVEALGEHFAKGRITQDEFDSRSSLALQCHTQPELDELLADMPKTAVVKQAKPAPPAPRWQPNFDRIGRVVLILALLAGVIQLFIQH